MAAEKEAAPNAELFPDQPGSLTRDLLQRFVVEQVYEDRQTRRTHPHGWFDGKKRFHPAATETQTCCVAVRAPTKQYPNSENAHCRTRKHVTALVGAHWDAPEKAPTDVRTAIEAAKKYATEGATIEGLQTLLNLLTSK